MLLDDAELISRVLAYDDHYAFSQLVRKYQSQLRLFLRRLLKNNYEIADELAQETFIIAYKKLQSFQHRSSFMSWLYAISKNLFLQHIRRTKTQFSWEEEDSIEISGQNIDLKVDLEKAMCILRPIERAAITMCHCQDLTHEEVSDILDIPLGTLKTHINRGKKKLQNHLFEYVQGD